MLDCPPQSQTSQTRTLVSVMVCGPEICSVYGPPTGGGTIFACQRPSAAAVTVATRPESSTRTFSPGLAQPQMELVLSRCKTMLSLNIGLRNGCGAARVVKAQTKLAHTKAMGRLGFMEWRIRNYGPSCSRKYRCGSTVTGVESRSGIAAGFVTSSVCQFTR